MAIFITGGARSGKSGFAEAYAKMLAKRGIYVATSQIWDEEMKERTDHHQESRAESGFAWETIEEPYEVAELLERLEAVHEEERPAVLIDCLTLWLTNQLLRVGELDESDGESFRYDSGALLVEVNRLVDAVSGYTGPLLLVTNEVGSGIVPPYPLGRRFRDEAGRMNRKLAACAEQAFLVVAGIPLDLKAHAFELGEE
ncbi:bifunctional adenosylcobinamide kinase/adenosylcobinamide-phosphate guanylyltransferase [Paenibacillus sp. CF384]|uniref:bifunctional adenosylcobinamide kinase/adenosylcobinamide-phosphate guanylyltransferase n=1 Tax=Paenibacillus sp. CF384 TaxID=1884382 RepID=UPI00089991C6|nr:bifunctional adenosylcobinamide kinase/adenosylcobinamide-phosphate guanylyltransferase [Paenibacillus sp. CF384]SDW25194.1 adenosylcobinamide kinase /adenosylcobinamide-phosphate guanylyltransferase [Paenibacillus sp. CF384]